MFGMSWPTTLVFGLCFFSALAILLVLLATVLNERSADGHFVMAWGEKEISGGGLGMLVCLFFACVGLIFYISHSADSAKSAGDLAKSRANTGASSTPSSTSSSSSTHPTEEASAKD